MIFDPQEWEKVISKAPRVCGIYGVWSGKNLLYIGTSENIYRRLKMHSKRKLFLSEGADSITYIGFWKDYDSWTNRNERYAMELFLTRKHLPKLNGYINMTRKIPKK